LFFSDAVRQNPLTKTVRESEIEDVIKDWLRMASGRSGAKSGAKSAPVNRAKSKTVERRQKHVHPTEDSVEESD
jgi:ribosomal protein L12E/L44/L45/RPP1/RPP2